VPKIIINNTINLFFLTAISILAISNHNSFRVLFDKNASVFEKDIYILASQKASPGTSTLRQLYRHIFVPYCGSQSANGRVRSPHPATEYDEVRPHM